MTIEIPDHVKDWLSTLVPPQQFEVGILHTQGDDSKTIMVMDMENGGPILRWKARNECQLG